MITLPTRKFKLLTSEQLYKLGPSQNEN